MYEPLSADSFALLALPGEWLRSASGSGVLHFFPEGASAALCNYVDRDTSWEPGGAANGLERCGTCARKLGSAHSRLEELEREPEPVIPPSVQQWHFARARHLAARAGREPNRFRKALLLAEAKKERQIGMRSGNPSGFGRVEFWP